MKVNGMIDTWIHIFKLEMKCVTCLDADDRSWHSAVECPCFVHMSFIKLDIGNLGCHFHIDFMVSDTFNIDRDRLLIDPFLWADICSFGCRAFLLGCVSCSISVLGVMFLAPIASLCCLARCPLHGQSQRQHTDSERFREHATHSFSIMVKLCTGILLDVLSCCLLVFSFPVNKVH